MEQVLCLEDRGTDSLEVGKGKAGSENPPQSVSLWEGQRAGPEVLRIRECSQGRRERH